MLIFVNQSTVAENFRFHYEQRVPFPLLSDERREVGQLYGVVLVGIYVCMYVCTVWRCFRGAIDICLLKKMITYILTSIHACICTYTYRGQASPGMLYWSIRKARSWRYVWYPLHTRSKMLQNMLTIISSLPFCVHVCMYVCMYL